MSAARWLRPMAASTGSDMVWGFTEIRLPPPARMANPKYPQEYLRTIDTIRAEKAAWV